MQTTGVGPPRKPSPANQLVPTGALVPPHDLDAESHVLSELILRGDECFDRIAEFLRSEHFYSDANRFVYDAIVAIQARNEKIDFTAVGSELRSTEKIQRIGGPPYLAQLVDVPSIGNIEQHARTVFNRWRQRQVIAVCQSYAAQGYGDVGELQPWIESAERSIEEIAHVVADSRFEPASVVAQRVYDMLAAAKERGETITGTPTGFADVDKKTAGLHDGDLTLVAGRPSLGKTSLVLAVALNVARGGDGVAMFSLEMPREQLAMRLLAMEAGVDVSRIRYAKLTNDDWSKLAQALTELKDLPLWIDDKPAISYLEMRSAARRLQREIAAGRATRQCRRLKLLVIDYLQLMHGDRPSGSNREQEVASVSRNLKNIAKDLSLAVMACSQLNRSVEKDGKNRRPQLSDLRESGSQEMDADNVWMLYRPDKSDGAAAQSETELIIAKQRNGPTGTIPLHFQPSTTKFMNAAGPGDVPPGEFDDFGDDLADV